MAENISTNVLGLVDSRGLFSHVDKRHKNKVKCNMLFLKILNNMDEEFYAIQEYDKLTNRINIRIPSEEEVEYLVNILLMDGTKVCKYEIGVSYLKESYLNSRVSFVLFSKHVDSRTRTQEALVNVCGFLLLDIIEHRNDKRDIYVKLVCAENRSASETLGLGSKLMKLTEAIGKVFKCDKILLSAVDKALGFYISKDFKAVKGTDLYEIPAGVKIPAFRRGQLLQENLPKTALFMNSAGMTTSFRDATRLLPKNNTLSINRRRTPRASAGRKFMGNGTIKAMTGVKLDVDEASSMVIMEKSLLPNNTAKPTSTQLVGFGKMKKTKKIKSKTKSLKNKSKNYKNKTKGKSLNKHVKK
jgi:hypothetical protein